MNKINNEEILKKGWIYKRSRFLHKWWKRYCVISENELYTFKTEDINEMPTEIVTFMTCSGVKSAED